MQLSLNHTINGLLTLALMMGCGQSIETPLRSLVIATVSKTDEAPFYARLASESQRVIVTDAFTAPSRGVNVDIPNNTNLFVVELDREHAPALANEVFREGKLSFFTASDEREAFLLAGKSYEFAHPRKVDLSSPKQPSTAISEQSAPTYFSSMQTFGDISIDPKLMREDLEALSGAKPIIIDGQSFTLTNRATADNKNKARAWLKKIYESLGFSVSEHRYSTGVNLVAEKRPASPVDDQIIVVSSHLDTVQTAGADDDGSGTISSLSIARALSGKDLRRTIRFVAFDEEERGLIGSDAYAKDLSKSGEISKISLINIEMTGYDSDNDGDFHAIDCNENSSPTLSRALLSAISAEGIALKKVDACTNRSDHAVFWEYDRPAIVMSQNFFGGDGNPCYHRTCDTVQKVNWEYMEKLTRASAYAVYGLVR